MTSVITEEGEIGKMVRTDTYKEIVDLKTRCDVTWQDLADRLKMKYGQNVIDAAHRGTLPANFVQLAEALGYDIEIRFIQRPHDMKEFVWKVSPGRKYNRKDPEA